jgi:uncharacterized membrane protein YdbT with pleckstrin-like domain
VAYDSSVPYPQKLLNDEESVVLDLRPHWWFLVPRMALLLFVLVVAILVVAQRAPQAVDLLMGVGVLVALGYFGLRYGEWMTTNFVVTTDRLIFRNGVLSKSGIEIPHERINTVIFNQSLFERVLGAGDLVIESAGETPSTFSDIRKPDIVQAEMYRQMEANENRKYDRIGGHVDRINVGGSLSVAEQLEKLDDLRTRGVISAEEFEAQKATLLGGGK